MTLMVHLLQMVLHASQLLVTSCYPRFSSSLKLSGQLKHLTFTKLYYTRLHNNTRLSGQLKHLTFTKALVYQASQQYETEWIVETPENREELDFYVWTIHAIITGRHFI